MAWELALESGRAGIIRSRDDLTFSLYMRGPSWCRGARDRARGIIGATLPAGLLGPSGYNRKMALT